MNWQELCTTQGITCKAKRVPSPTKGSDGWERTANHYRVTLRRDGRSMTVSFHTGTGWTRDPEAWDVLECLTSDAFGVAFQGFEEWCADYGYDTDSRKALQCYHACEATARKLPAWWPDWQTATSGVDG